MARIIQVLFTSPTRNRIHYRINAFLESESGVKNPLGITAGDDFIAVAIGCGFLRYMRLVCSQRYEKCQLRVFRRYVAVTRDVS